MKTGIFKDNKGFSLIELMIVIVIVGILAGFGMPEYGRYVAKSRVRSAATELIQNMRMIRTMAIKENRTYIVTFNTGTNTYTMGFDGDSDNSLGNPIQDFYGSGPVRVINVPIEYGLDIVLGAANFVINPPNGPNGVVINDQAIFRFMADSSASPNGMVYFQDNMRAYTFCVELANTAGMTNMFMWQGDNNNPNVTAWTELR